MMLEWLAYILRRNVAVQQEVCLVITEVKLSLGAQETRLSKETCKQYAASPERIHSPRKIINLAENVIQILME